MDITAMVIYGFEIESDDTATGTVLRYDEITGQPYDHELELGYCELIIDGKSVANEKDDENYNQGYGLGELYIYQHGSEYGTSYLGINVVEDTFDYDGTQFDIDIEKLNENETIKRLMEEYDLIPKFYLIGRC